MTGYTTYGRLGLATLAAAGMLLVAGTASVHAEVRVRQTGSTPAEPYDTWENAANNIQTAIDYAAANGLDTVVVSNGTYGITAQINVTAAITVRSVNGAAVTTVERTSGSIRIFNVNHADAVLDGFTIRNGFGVNQGSGVYLGAGTVRNSVIRDNKTSANGAQAAGLWMQTGAVVSNCVFTANRLHSVNLLGGAIYANGGLIVDSVVTNNGDAITSAGGIWADTTALIRNCLIMDNEGIYGGVFRGVVENCTIVNNRGRSAGGTFNSTVRNSIVYHNEARFSTGDNHSGGTFSYSCTTPDPGGTGNITADPQIEAGSVPLPMPGSPCIDAGSDDLWLGGDTDLSGNPRQSGAGIDMGAYEFQAGTLDCGFIADAPSGIAPHEVEFTAYTNGIDATGLTYYWDFDNNGVWNQQGTDTQVVTHTYTTPGLYTVKLTVSNSVSESVTRIREGYIRAPAVDLYVCADGTSTPPYTNWAGAAKTIREAVDMSADGCTIWVADGSYSEHVRVKKGITLSSTNGYAGAILNEPGNWSVSVNHPDAIVRGFTITRASGNAHGVWHYAGRVTDCLITNHGAMYNHAKGGGMVMYAGAVVSNCTFTGNVGNIYGGDNRGMAIYAEGGLITHSVFTNNGAGGTHGGAIFAAAGTIIRNSLIQGNTASGQGGGVYGGIVESCTIVGNTAATGGGTLGSVVTNSIVYFNTAGTGPNYSGGSFAYSCSTPVPAGVGNTDADGDPRFVDAEAHDYRLRATASLVDAGTNLAWMIGATDLIGNPRITGDRTDMGAYEYVSDGVPVCDISADVTRGIAPHTVVFTALTANFSPGEWTYRWDFNNNGAWDQQGTDKDVVTHTYHVPGIYSVKLSVTNTMAGEGATTVLIDTITVPGTNVYVSPSGTGVVPYTTLETAATNLQDALDVSADGCTVWVDDGAYGYHVVDKGITLRSINGPSGALLNGGGTYCLIVNHSNAVIRGFTVNNANMHGRGIKLDAGSVLDSRIENNRAEGNLIHGGGIYMYPGSLVSNCTFIGNTGGSGENRGMAIYAEGGLITHCVFKNNGTGGNIGGAIFAAAGTIIRNCLIQGNTASSSGGGVHGGIVEHCTVVGNTSATGGGTRNSIVSNSIVYFNTATTSGDNYSGGTFTYSLSTPKPDGEGNIEANPLFVDAAAGDYRLQYKPVMSPAIDAGTPPPNRRMPYEGDLAWLNTAVDLAGNPRYSDHAVDMGAYETELPPAGSLFLLR